MVSRKIITSLVLGLLLVPALVYAQTPPASPAAEFRPQDLPFNKNPGLKLAPTKFEETVTPGRPKDGRVDVINISKQPLTVVPEVENIRMIGDDGDLEFYIGDNPYKISGFVEIDKTPFVLDVGEARTVRFRLNIPAGVYPGGYFGSILFRIVPPDVSSEGNTVLQGGRVGSLLILNAEGDSQHKGQIDSASLMKNQFSDEKIFKVVYANTGNTDTRPLGTAYRPVGTLRIKNMLGLTVRTQSLTGEQVFPGAKRKFEPKLKKALWFGRYTAEVQLSPGPGQPPDIKRIHFWAISPLGLALTVVLIAVVLAWLLYVRRRRTPGGAVSHHSSSLMDEAARIGKRR